MLLSILSALSTFAFILYPAGLVAIGVERFIGLSIFDKNISILEHIYQTIRVLNSETDTPPSITEVYDKKSIAFRSFQVASKPRAKIS